MYGNSPFLVLTFECLGSWKATMNGQEYTYAALQSLDIKDIEESFKCMVRFQKEESYIYIMVRLKRGELQMYGRLNVRKATNVW